MESSLSQLNLFSLILQLDIVNRDHLDLSVVMKVDAKSKWIESGLADCARLSSSYKKIVFIIWNKQIDKVQLHTQIMITIWSSNEKYLVWSKAFIRCYYYRVGINQCNKRTWYS